MAKTKTSVHGKQHKKYVTVEPYTKKDGTKVHRYDRSVPKAKAQPRKLNNAQQQH